MHLLAVAVLAVPPLATHWLCDSVLSPEPNCHHPTPLERLQTSGAPATVGEASCAQWTFLHTWDDEHNFITSPPPFMSPLRRPPADSTLLTVARESLTLVRINVYEPIAWIVGKAMIVRGMWAEREREAEGTAGEDVNKVLDFRLYSFYVRRQSLAIHCLNSGLLAFLVYVLLGKLTGDGGEGAAGAPRRAVSAAAAAVSVPTPTPFLLVPAH